MSARPELPAPTYLGDGVYASFDGYQLWLHVGSHDAPGAVAIEPAVLAALNGYAKRVGMVREAAQ